MGDLLKFVLILSFSIIISRIITLYLRRSFKDKVSKDAGETILKLFYYGTIHYCFYRHTPSDRA